jgi:hypothetical protein
MPVNTTATNDETCKLGSNVIRVLRFASELDPVYFAFLVTSLWHDIEPKRLCRVKFKYFDWNTGLLRLAQGKRSRELRDCEDDTRELSAYCVHLWSTILEASAFSQDGPFTSHNARIVEDLCARTGLVFTNWEDLQDEIRCLVFDHGSKDAVMHYLLREAGVELQNLRWTPGIGAAEHTAAPCETASEIAVPA